MFDSLQDAWPLNIIGFFCLVIVPFILSTVLPAIFIPRWGLKFMRQTPDKKTLQLFSVFVISLSIISMFVWEGAIFNHQYYEWDRGFLSYSLAVHETPNIGSNPFLLEGKLQGEGSWVLASTGFIGLTLIWLSMTYAVYLTAGFFTYLFSQRDKKTTQQIAISSVSLVLFTFPFVIPGLSLLFFLPGILLGGGIPVALRSLGVIH